MSLRKSLTVQDCNIKLKLPRGKKNKTKKGKKERKEDISKGKHYENCKSNLSQDTSDAFYIIRSVLILTRVVK